MIRSHSDFIECWDLVDQVFERMNKEKIHSFFTCPDRYIERSQSKLRELGLSDSDWFVGLHVRDGSKVPALRNQSLQNYLPAINEIIKRGGWVIRIGGPEMPPIPKMSRVIDLVQEIEAARDLHLYILAKSKFFVATNSGPSWVPSLFGVPTIQTNAIAPGRTILRFCPNSFSIPKTILKGKSKLGFSSTLMSQFGFGEKTLSEYAYDDLFVEENSSQDILRAVQEMFDRLSGRTLTAYDDLRNKVDAIRSEIAWTSKGEISNQFLLANEEWYLK
jgi:putative glycosyltransferase (TIGR04372 family)